MRNFILKPKSLFTKLAGRAVSAASDGIKIKKAAKFEKIPTGNTRLTRWRPAPPPHHGHWGGRGRGKNGKRIE